jgi:hypothetical protein
LIWSSWDLTKSEYDFEVFCAGDTISAPGGVNERQLPP